MIELNYSGVAGLQGSPGYNGTSQFALGMHGGPGTNGARGTDGMPGKLMNVILTTENQSLIVSETTQNKSIRQMVLGDDKNQLNLITYGGNGGYGGRGGDGGRGGAGINGHNATRGSSGTNGGPGGHGGDAGSGGAGGIGGAGGQINLSVASADMDLFMVLEKVNIKGGTGGNGGGGGTGGAGGPGGRGGQSYSWTTTVDGVTHYHSNSGGYNGPSGGTGRHGNSGAPGMNGQDGSMTYSVDQTRFASRYDLIIKNVEKVRSEDDIIEPGESLSITMMDVENNGGMYTPVKQQIILSLDDNQYVKFNQIDQVNIVQSLIPGGHYFLHKPLNFKIADITTTSFDKPFRVKAKVDYRATVERVNKQFKGITAQVDMYDIQHPIEMSPIQVLRSITIDEESPFAVAIWNRSTRPLGLMSETKRLLNFRLMLENSSQTVEFVAKNVMDFNKINRNAINEAQMALDQQYFIAPNQKEINNIILEQDFITELPPGGKAIFSGTIKLKELDLPLYTQIPIQAKLDLGYYHDKQKVFHNIQANRFHIQLTEKHQYKMNSDFLFLFNCNTPSSLIDSFKNFARSFDSNVDLWNISSYQGFSFDYIVRPENKAISTLYKDKVFIIHNSVYDQISSKKTSAIDEIQAHNIFDAAKSNGINIYVINQTQNYFYLSNPITNRYTDNIQVYTVEKPLLEAFKNITPNNPEPLKMEITEPLLNDIMKENPIAITFNYEHHASFTCCSKPEQRHLDEEVTKLVNQISLDNPKHMHLISHKYKAERKIVKTFADSYSLGMITLTEGLRRDRSSIIERFQCPNPQQLDKVDYFALLKLLPFHRKLDFLTRSLHDIERADILFSAILSDLTDEYLTFQKFQNHNTAQIQNTLVAWTAFSMYPFIEKFAKAEVTLVKINEKKNSQPQEAAPTQQNYQYTHDINVTIDPSLLNQANITIQGPGAQPLPSQFLQKPTAKPMPTPESNQIRPDESSKEVIKTIRNSMIDKLTKLKYALIRQLPFASSICCCGSLRKVTNHCLSVLEMSLDQHFNLPQDEQKAKIKDILAIQKQTQKQTLLDTFRKPYMDINRLPGTLIVNNHAPPAKTLQADQIPKFLGSDKLPYIQRGSFMFIDTQTNELNEQKRQIKIDQFESLIDFKQ